MHAKSPTRIAWLSALIFVLVQVVAAQSSPHLFTYSTLDALMAGVYDGELTLRELEAKGDFGIGTFNRLDGELILLDGVFYHARADGSVVVAGADEKTPLAYVTQFRPDATLKAENTFTLQQFEDWLDAHLRNQNLFYAIRVEGLFRDASTRSIAPQRKPYKPLAEVAAAQSVYRHSMTRGVLVGFRSPAFSKGISVPRYHWHFLAGDRKHGGHLLKMAVADAVVQVQQISEFNLRLPRTEAFAAADQVKDRTQEIRQVEGR
jgi:acetolactate decarboxylase